MKGLLVFSSMNDIVYIHYDEKFKEHVNQRALECGIIAESQIDDPPDANAIVQLFSPLINSFSMMDSHMKNPYHTIECQDGMLFVFEQFHDQTHLAINGDRTETAEFLHRKLLVLQRIITFNFGPVLSEMRPDRIADRKFRWSQMSCLLDMWADLYQKEHGFLVEAIERLHVNQMLNAKCIELLESALNVMKTAGEKNVAHALVIVNAKLLSLFSTRNASELQPSDILLMILLVKSLFPTNQRLEDLFSRSYIAPNLDDAETMPVDIKVGADETYYESASEGNDESDDGEYYSPPPSPTVPRSDEFKSLNEARDYFDVIPPSSKPTRRSSTTDATRVDTGQKLSLGSEGGYANRHRNPSNVSFRSVNPEVEHEPYHRCTVFLGTPSCSYTPYTLHCIEIMPGVIMVIVAEVSRGKQVWAISQILSTLTNIVNQGGRETSSQGRYNMDTIDSCLKKIQDMLKKLKGSAGLERVMGEVLDRWASAKNNGLLSYLDQSRKTEIPARLEGPLISMHKKMNDLFKKLYLVPWKHSAAVQQSQRNAINYIQQISLQHLWDYKDYLAVKAQRNIVLTNYVEDFQGLVHFIYVNRTSHQMMAPSINVTSEVEDEKNNMELMIRIKDKIWKQVPQIQKKLHDGFLSQSVREGDLLFTYYLWYEDTMGIAVAPQQPYRGCADNILPGILAGNFYRQMQRQCLPAYHNRSLQCFELITVHFGLVPATFVLRHCRRLASKLLDTTGEASSPISIL